MNRLPFLISKKWEAVQEGGIRMEYTGTITVAESTKYRICAYKEGMSFDDYSERLNIDVTVKEDDTPVEPIVPDVPSNPTTPDSPSNPTSPSGPDSSRAELGQTKAVNANGASAFATTGDSLFPFALAALLLSVCAGGCFGCIEEKEPGNITLSF